MATLIRNSTDRIGVVVNDVVGYRVQETEDDCTMSVFLSGILPEVQFEEASSIEELTPLVADFITALQAA